MTVRVPIEPAALRWAVGRAGLSDRDVERIFPAFAKWESGELQPTLRQAKDLAKKAHVPFGRLLLSPPEGSSLAVPDFRTVRNRDVAAPSSDLEDVVSAAQARLGWYVEYADQEGVEAPELVGMAGRDATTPSDIAVAAREKLGIPQDGFLIGQDKVKTLVDAMEQAGILVSRNSVVGNNTNRQLDVEEFRGFTLLENGFAAVFVNTRDPKNAQLFSLAHELGHIVRGEPGISDHSQQLEVERWCNRFAASFLVPKAALQRAWNPQEQLVDELSATAKVSGVSREVLLWRLVELEMVSRTEADRLLPILRSKGVGAEKTAKPSGSPPFHVLVKSRVGGRFLEAVAHAVTADMLTERDAATFVGAATKQALDSVLNNSAYAKALAS